MKRFAVVLSLLCFASAHGAELRNGKSITIQENQNEILFVGADHASIKMKSTDDLFAAAGTLDVSLHSKDKLVCAGGEISIKDTDVRDGWVAGGEVTLDRAHFTDLVLAGGEVTLNGTQVDDDLVLAGGEIELSRDVHVGGVSMVAGGDVSLNGTFAKKVYVVGGDVVLWGKFAGDVEVRASKLHILEGTAITGNLAYRSEKKLILDDGVKISGKTIVLEPWEKESPSTAAVILMIVGGLLVGVGLWVLHPLSIILLPKLFDRAQARFRGDRIRCLGWGFVGVTAGPVVFLVALFSGVGTPLALFFIPIFVLLCFLAWSTVIFEVTTWVREAWEKRKNKGKKVGSFSSLKGSSRFTWLMLGAFVTWIVFSLPILGGLLTLLGFVAGLGALVPELLQALKKA